MFYFIEIIFFIMIKEIIVIDLRVVRIVNGENMENINLTTEQINNARCHFFDEVCAWEKGDVRLTAMSEVSEPAGDGFWTNGNQSQVIVNFEVSVWENDEPVDSTVNFFPEDFDSAWIEFEFQALIQKGKMTDIFLEGK